MPPYPGFIGASAQSLSPSAANERTVNFYLERIQATYNAKSELALYPTPGLEEFAVSATNVRGRGIFEENGRVFAVIGERLLEAAVATFGTPPPGTLNTDRGFILETISGEPVDITSNGDGGQEVAVAAADRLYVLNLTTNLLTEALPSGARHAVGVDGFILVLDTSDSTLRCSNLYAATVFDPLAIEQRASQPDPWLSLGTANSLVYVMGERTTDVYYNAGLSPFPFQRHSGGTIPFGIAAPYSRANVGEALMWLGRNADGMGQIVRVVGQQAEDVADFNVAAAIQGYVDAGLDLSDAVGDSFELMKHVFYVLTFPTADATWLYDATMGKWTELLSWNSAGGVYTAWRAMWHTVGFGRHLILDRSTGQMFTLSSSVYTEDGNTIRRMRQAPTLYDGHKRFFLSELELILQVGIGLSNPLAQGYTPEVILEKSKNNGQTWQQCGSAKSAGKIGEYATRVHWNRLGAARDASFRVIVTDPVAWRLIAAEITIRPGAGT